MQPSLDTFTSCMSIPAICADAGFVPCADVGIKQTFLSSSPRCRWYFIIAHSPANSPCEPLKYDNATRVRLLSHCLFIMCTFVPIGLERYFIVTG